MRPEQPEIARPADRVDRRLGDLVLALAGAVLVAEPGEQPVQLGVVEAGQARSKPSPCRSPSSSPSSASSHSAFSLARLSISR